MISVALQLGALEQHGTRSVGRNKILLQFDINNKLWVFWKS